MVMDVVTATVRDEDISLRLPAGSSVNVPQDTLSRSTVLRQALSDGGTEDDLNFTLPSGVLASWLQCTAALKSGFARVKCATPGTDACTGKRLLEFLKVGSDI